MSWGTGPKLARAALAAALLLSAGGASAQPSQDVYRAHMENGVKLYQDKNLDAAITEFQAAYDAKPSPNPLLNIALCYKSSFNYPKAISTLEGALAKHGDEMEPKDKKAAQDAIAEMRALLATVEVKVTPPQATLTVDGEDQPGTGGTRSVSLGPGPHKVGAHAEGFAAQEQPVSVKSGDRTSLALTLAPDKGYVIVRTDDAKMAIAMDGKFVAYGAWGGFATPGTHVVQMYKPGGKSYSVQILVAVGKSQEVRPGMQGVQLGTPVGTPPPPPDPKKQPPEPPKKPEPQKRGAFAMATASLLGPVNDPNAFRDAKSNFGGGAGGLRIGYRVNTPASFDAMFEYHSVTVEKAGIDALLGETPDYTLSSIHLGLNLRLMSPGKSVRFVGVLGGGATHSTFTFEPNTSDPAALSTQKAELRKCVSGCSGWDGYLLGELGLEIELSGVLLGLTFQNYFQSARGIAERPWGNDPLILAGGGIHVGYALW